MGQCAYNLEQVSARFEIHDLLYRYAELIDTKQFDQLDEVFTEDAYIDYTAMGGSKGDLTETIAFLTLAMAKFPNSQHLNGNMQIRLVGDSDIKEASGRIMFYNPMQMLVSNVLEGDVKNKSKIVMCGAWYIDQYLKVGNTWKIRRRSEEKSWVYGF